MTNNIIALNTRDLITDTLIEITNQLGPIVDTDPAFPLLQAASRELSKLNFLIVVDDIRQMADTINEHNAELQKLVEQIQDTTDQLTQLADRLRKINDAVAFVVDTAAKATALGLL